MILSFRNLLYALMTGCISVATLAEGSSTDLCDQSIDRVSATSIVPREVLYKIARLESGWHIDGRHISWPWSLNNGGKGYFLKDKAAGLATLAKLRAQGKTNIDVGCMQLNVRWHAEFFKNPEQMMNPLDNVRYAARYLEKLYEETGSWEKAVKFYHSRNSRFNTAYYAKYKKVSLPTKSPMPASLISNMTPTYSRNSNDFHGLSLFWTSSTGALIDTVVGGSSSIIIHNIKKFSVLPLIEM